MPFDVYMYKYANLKWIAWLCIEITKIVWQINQSLLQQMPHSFTHWSGERIAGFTLEFRIRTFESGATKVVFHSHIGRLFGVRHRRTYDRIRNVKNEMCSIKIHVVFRRWIASLRRWIITHLSVVHSKICSAKITIDYRWILLY